MQPRAGMVRAGEAAAAEADGRHVEVAAVLLDEQVGRRLRGAEERVQAAVDRHRGRDAVEVLVLRAAARAASRAPRAAGSSAGRRRPCSSSVKTNVASGLCRRVASSRLSVPFALTREVGLRIRRRPVVRRLRGRVDDELELAGVPREDAGRRRRRRGCRGRASGTRRRRSTQALGLGARRRVGPEEAGAHVVLDPDHVVARLDEVRDGLRADQPARARHDRDRHASPSAQPSAERSSASCAPIHAACPSSTLAGLRRGRHSVWANKARAVGDVDWHVARPRAGSASTSTRRSR